jgi:hypothetical protein
MVIVSSDGYILTDFSSQQITNGNRMDLTVIAKQLYPKQNAK